ncbi:DUF1816 domain-containing protein [Oculatella sp. LEGE 06141]|uniref:DUF1816 domain-containing protein n=1 Tax=Oculatella sp. LEGE 06141 TaxID=1828648 RepID=UPI00188097BD|nr:DUF1816 domain-containing protein [Oculatella sp. LEGE 06141]MBE9180725.1 DUF1816 domain-containing protein [Oculatella sp. LEGE 06141]
MKEIWTNLLQAFGLAWWVEVVTENPNCTYYFGPFANSKEARMAKSGYIEDLEHESAQGIKALVKRCKPGTLTVYDEASEPSGMSASSPVFSS